MANKNSVQSNSSTAHSNPQQQAQDKNVQVQPAAQPPVQSASQSATQPPQASPTTLADKQPTASEKSPSPSTKSNRKPLIYYLPLATIILGAMLVTQLLLITIFGNNVRQQVTAQAINERQQTDHTLAQAAVTEYQSDIESLTLSFPDLEGIREFAQTMNQQLDQFPEKEFNISTNEPVQTQELFAPLIPVSISVTATPSAFTPIMEKLSQSRYLFQPVYLEVNAVDGLSNPGMIDYRGNLFVSKKLLIHN